jgi:hypothetical protein
MASFEIVESLCEGKISPERNEDRLVITPHFVGVVDGATSSAPLANGKPGGIVAAEAIAAAVQTLDPLATARQAVDHFTAAVSKATGDWPDPTKGRPCAAVVIFSSVRREIWRVCDGHFALDGVAYQGEKMVDIISYTYRSAMLRARLKLGLTTVEAAQTMEECRDFVHAFSSVQHTYANNPGDPMGYGVINGLPGPDALIETHAVGDTKEIVLCSDGFFYPYPTLAQAMAENKRLYHDDPLLCHKVNGGRSFMPGATWFDDATYVRFRLTTPTS